MHLSLISPSFSFTCSLLFLFLHTNTSTWALSPSHPVTLSHPLSLSECRMFNSRLRVAGRVVSFGWSVSPVPTQAYCLHTGVMDSVAADTAHISPSCPVPWGWTIIAHHRTAMVTPYMARKEWLITWLRGSAFCFPMKFASVLSAWHVKWLTDLSRTLSREEIENTGRGCGFLVIQALLLLWLWCLSADGMFKFFRDWLKCSQSAISFYFGVIFLSIAKNPVTLSLENL